MSAHTARAVRLLPLAALVAAGGCFATRNDVRVVQADLASFRTEQLKANADERVALANAVRTVGIAADSVRVMSNRLTSVQGDIRGGLRDVNSQLLEVQELLKQSAGRLEQLRKDQEIRANQAASVPVMPTGVPMTSADSIAMATAASTTQTGPRELLSNGRMQQSRGSWSTAREIYQDLLLNYPTSEQAPAAQLYIGQTYEGAKNMAAALPAYAVVVQKYPDSPQAPSSLYKRANILKDQGKTAEAKALLNTIITRYKGSLEFALAEDMLKNMK